MKLRMILAALSGLFIMTSQVSCANHPDNYSSSSDASLGEKPSVLPGHIAYPLLWESKKTDGRNWTDYVFTLIHQQEPSLLQGAEDITNFCPGYYKLNTNERINFWGLLVSGIVKYESNFDPTSRMHETTMGTDPVTGKPVYSEGLMQLSYQDVRNYRFCDEFDWSSDKHLHPQDPKKTILDPYKNLNCGVKILAQQIRNKNRITVSKGVYWAVIRLDGRNNKIAQISALTKKMPGCMN